MKTEETDIDTTPPTTRTQRERTTEWTYIWIAGDGSIRSTMYKMVGQPKVQRIDGSACKQASTENSDLYLVPVRAYADVFSADILSDLGASWGVVLCEVQTADGTPHASNTRATLSKFLESAPSLEQVGIGFEQDVILIDPDNRQPYKWPTSKDDAGNTQVVFPGPQGRYYGGSGDFVRGRGIADAFVDQCQYKNIYVEHITPGICLSQWTYNLKKNSILAACDDLILSRYMLEKVAEQETAPRCVVSYVPKSFPGTEWNGNGCVIKMYLPNYIASNGNPDLAKSICETIGADHRAHMVCYGMGNDQRLIGKTGGISDYNTFTWGYGDRTASLCVPVVPTAIRDTVGAFDPQDFMYIEDRRPGGNIDPYFAVLALSKSLVNVVELPVPAEAESPELNLVS
jgi:glutamine synthetase